MSQKLQQTKITDFSDSDDSSRMTSETSGKRKNTDMSDENNQTKTSKFFKRSFDKRDEVGEKKADDRVDVKAGEDGSDSDSSIDNLDHEEESFTILQAPKEMAEDHEEGEQFYDAIEDSDPDETETKEDIHTQEETASDDSNEMKFYKETDGEENPPHLDAPNEDTVEDGTQGYESFEHDQREELKFVPDVEKYTKTKLSELSRQSEEFNRRKLENLESTKWDGKTTHHVLFKPETEKSDYEWSDDCVRMPCDPENKIPIYTSTGELKFDKRWNKIKDAFSRPIKDVFRFQKAILSYNGHRSESWDFQCLKDYFLKSKFKWERLEFFDQLLPKVIEKALQMEALFPKSIPLLKNGENCMITMTQDQAFCLLANAFLCTFPWRSSDKKFNASSLPSINFSSLFNGKASNNRCEKLKCILHYFKRVTGRPSGRSRTGNISFRRQVLQECPDWGKLKTNFTKMYVSSEGVIEHTGAGMLQVDFANKYVGGGVIRHGCVQEEIRFLICPEMILSRLFTEVLGDHEVLIMTGCEQFSNYTGYSQTFQWSGDHVDQVARDFWDRRFTEVVAMDAVVIKDRNEQYEKFHIERELNKAYCAFMCPDAYTERIPAVCTGNWGCGAFGGEKELKALIQLMAASKAERDVCFLTFHDEKFAKNLEYIHSSIRKNKLEVEDIMQRLREFNNKKEYKTSTLFNSIRDLW